MEQQKRGHNGNGFKKGYKQSDKHRENLKVSRKENKEFNFEKKKICIKGHPYTSENIYTNKKGHRSCLTCRKNRFELYRINNLKKHSENIKRWRLKNPEKVREGAWKSSIKRHYNMTPEQYSEMLKNQNSKCAICGKEDKEKKLCIDHNHKSGKVRKLLCNHCNHILGLSYENIEILKSAINYLNNNI